MPTHTITRMCFSPMKTTGDTKHCPRCNRDLPTGSFSKNRSNLDGLASCRKECQLEYNRKWRAAKGLTPALATGSKAAPEATPDGKQPREIIAEIRERITALRDLGYAFEGKLTYLHEIKL